MYPVSSPLHCRLFLSTLCVFPLRNRPCLFKCWVFCEVHTHGDGKRQEGHRGAPGAGLRGHNKKGPLEGGGGGCSPCSKNHFLPVFTHFYLHFRRQSLKKLGRGRKEVKSHAARVGHSLLLLLTRVCQSSPQSTGIRLQVIHRDHRQTLDEALGRELTHAGLLFSHHDQKSPMMTVSPPVLLLLGGPERYRSDIEAHRLTLSFHVVHCDACLWFSQTCVCTRAKFYILHKIFSRGLERKGRAG
mmetsp:Transcript_3749/g.7725  ORF Transcript_3749/g.7725 Transcript_3749/m.7725 type:complete len:243 (-) Transcript_3749:551-1279(-)